MGVVVGGGGGTVVDIGAVAGVGTASGAGGGEGLTDVVEGVAGALDAVGEVVPGGIEITTTDQVPQESVTFPCTCPAALSPENR